MLKELCWMHSKLTKNECMRIIMTVPDWEIHADKTDIVGEFNGCFRIVRANGRIVSINPDNVALMCTMKKEASL